MRSNLPLEVEEYLAEVVVRLVNHLQDQLVGVYLFGSAANQAFEPGLSDLDVQAVVKEPLSDAEKRTIIDRVNQRTLSCPASKLEFVVYTQRAVNPANRHPRFELNLNTGPHQSDHVAPDPADESSHWFLLDIAMGRQLGRRLYSLDVPAAFGAIPHRWILEAMSDSLEWNRENELRSANGVLNACRNWQFVSLGKFSSKADGATWAMQQRGCPSIVKEAVESRKSKQDFPAIRVKEIYEVVMRAIRTQLETDDESR